jgi:hypothetical protein
MIRFVGFKYQMKISYYSFFSFSLLFIFSCSKELIKDSSSLEKFEDLTQLVIRPNNDNLYATAVKVIPDGRSVSWKANTYVYPGEFNCTFFNLSDTMNYFTREFLINEKLDTSILITQKVFKFRTPNVLTCFFTRTEDDGCFSDGEWDLDDSLNNYIRLTKYDYKNKIVEGEFEANFKLTKQGIMGYKFAEKFSLKNGKFRARLP